MRGKKRSSKILILNYKIAKKNLQSVGFVLFSVMWGGFFDWFHLQAYCLVSLYVDKPGSGLRCNHFLLSLK